jgi:hypothetical protein
MRTARAIAFAALVAVPIACSSFTSTDTGPAPDASDDLTPPPPPAPPADDSGGGDDSAAHVDATAPFCGAVHAFCDSFDSTAVGSVPAWSGTPVIDGGGSVRVAMFGAALSPPNVLETTATSPSKANITEDITVTRGISCAFDLQIVAREKSSSGALFGRLVLDGGGTTFTVDLRVDGGSGGVVSAVGKSSNVSFGGALQPFTGLSDKTWAHVVMEIAYGAGGHASVAVDKRQVYTFTAAPFTTPPMSTTAHLTLGIEPYASPGSWHFVYDDVVCDEL